MSLFCCLTESIKCILEPQQPFVFMDYGTADGTGVTKVLPGIIGELCVVFTFARKRLTNFDLGGHGGRVVTFLPPTSEAGVRSPSWP